MARVEAISMSAGTMPINDHAGRQLRQEELEIVLWMLRNASTVGPLDNLIPTVEYLRVVGGCDCGCPSVDFTIGGQAGENKPIADALGVSPEGEEVGLILWGKSSGITGLEVYGLSNKCKFSLPRVEQLQTWEQSAKRLSN